MQYRSELAADETDVFGAVRTFRAECKDSLSSSIPIELVGVSYHNAGLQIRGPLGFAGPSLDRVVLRFLNEGFEECIVLSTCNRTEAYFVGGCREVAERILAEESGLPFEELRPYLYSKLGPCAAAHLFTVASGLDSAVLGETEILAQIKAAVATGRRLRAVGRHLDFLIRKSQGVSRRVRTETELCRNVTSVGSLAVRDAEARTGGFSGKTIMVIGAGKIAERIAKDLVLSKPCRLLFANRTFAHADTLARRYGGEAFPYADLESTLEHTDVVFTAASAEKPILDAEAMMRISGRRNKRALTIVDLGVPSNIHPSAALLPELEVLDMDGLATRCEENSARRMASVPGAIEIVEEELSEYETECTRRSASPTIEALVKYGENVKHQNLEWANEKLAHLPEQDLKVVADLAARMVKGFLQAPIRELKEELTAQQHRDLVIKLFHLETGGSQDR